MRVCQPPRIVFGDRGVLSAYLKAGLGRNIPCMPAWADVINGGMTPQAAVEKASKRVEEIFAKYPIAQTE
jgi:hypothetical protein